MSVSAAPDIYIDHLADEEGDDALAREVRAGLARELKDFPPKLFYVTAESNRNVLHVVNARLGADFDPEAFEHVAYFDEATGWIEMRLRARGVQRVRVAGADLEVSFADGEDMRTEISAKFTRQTIASDLATAGLVLDDFHTDEAGLFGLASASLPQRP